MAGNPADPPNADLPRRSPTRGRPRGDAAWPAGLVALVAAAYSRVPFNDFVSFDDYQLILENPLVRAGITGRGIEAALTRSYAGNWLPVTWISHMLDVELFGIAPAGHHLVSVACHALAAVLLFYALRRLAGSSAAAGCAAALFAVHPLHVESVAWVAERKDVLCGLFWAAALLAHARYAERPGPGRLAAVVALHALCLMSKPMGVTLPLVLLLLDWWPLGRRVPLGRLLVEKAPLFALSAFAGLVAYRAQLGAGAVESLPLGDRIAGPALALWRYLGLAVWPAGLSAFYPRDPEGFPVARAAAAVAAALALTAVAWLLRRRLPYLWTGWLWYLVVLAPVSGVVPVGGAAIADRYTYLPLTGPFLALGCGLRRLAARGPRARRLLVATAAAATLTLAAATWRQTAHWRSTETLFAQALRATENNWFAENSYAGALLARGRTDEAIAHLEESIRINPRYRKARLNLARTLESVGRRGEALVHYRAAGVAE